MSRYFSLLWEEVTTHQVSSERGERVVRSGTGNIIVFISDNREESKYHR